MNKYEIPAYIRRELDPVKREKLLTEWKSQNKNWARKMKEAFVMWMAAVSVTGVMIFMLLRLTGVSDDVITEFIVLSAIFRVLFGLMAELDLFKCKGE